MSEDAVVHALGAAARALAREYADAIALALDSHERPGFSARAAVVDAIPSPSVREQAESVYEAWERSGLSGSVIALALRAAASGVEGQRRIQTLDLVLTGPESAHVPTRRTEDIIVEIADGAREQLIMVTFASSPVPEIEQALRRAGERGVDIRLVVETVDDSRGRLTVDAAEPFRHLRGFVRVFTWPLTGRPQNAVMHAKVAVADGERAFVTSANLTGAALHRNMEVGIGITGGTIPLRLMDHYRSLMDRKVLVEQSDGPP